MIDVNVKVPEERIADFYAMYGSWLGRAGPTDGGGDDPVSIAKAKDWSDTAEDEAFARVVWGKFSDRAKSMFGTLMDSPEQKFSGEDLAELHDIPHGKYGTAGVLAWPGRHSAAVDRLLPCKYEDGQVGASALYWMTSEAAAVFRKVREAQ